MDNANSREYLEKILTQVLGNMRRTVHAPSVQMTDVPRESLGMNDDDEAALDDLDEDENPDKRITEHKADKYTEKNGELSDSEDEEMEGMNGRPSSRKRRVMQNYRHITDVGGNDSGVETGSGMGTPQQGSSLPDDADEMNVDETDDKVAQTPSLSNEVVNGSAAVSVPPSPVPVQPEDGDVEMGEADTNGDVQAEDDDVQPMEEESTITVQQQRTPPASPPTPQQEDPSPAPPATTVTETATEVEDPTTVAVAVPTMSTTEFEATRATAEEAAIKQEVIGDDDVPQAQEEGRMERETANAEGEAMTEAVAKAEAEDGGGGEREKENAATTATEAGTTTGTGLES